MARLVLWLLLALTLLSGPVTPARAEDGLSRMQVRLPTRLVGPLNFQIQEQLRRRFGVVQPTMHGTTLIADFARQRNVVPNNHSSGTIVVAFHPSTQSNVSVMSVLIVSNLYLATRLSDDEDGWHRPSQAQERSYRERIFLSIFEAVQHVCRGSLVRVQAEYVCRK